MKMYEILSYWAAREDEFPEKLRIREETGCCNSTIAGTDAGAVGTHDPPA